MRLKQLKEDDGQFGHKAGDTFLVDDADYDEEKVIGVKLKLEVCENSFYKHQLKRASLGDIEVIANELLNSPPDGGANE